MSYTNRDFVSQVRSMNKLLSSDQLITDRAILHEGKDVVNTLVKQSLDKRKLWQSSNLFAYIPCLEMEKVPITECCEYTSDVMIAKSKLKLPKIGEGMWGLAIQGVFGLDMNKKFKEVTPTRYSNILKLKLKTKDIYYWILNDYLYVTNSFTERVHIFLYPTEVVSNELLYPNAECSCITQPQIESLCANPMDQPFYCPADRISDVKNITYQSLLKTYFNLPIDKSADGNDETSKN